MKKRIWPGMIAGAVFLGDRVTKILAERIPPEGSTLIPGVVGLRYAQNRGIAFSLLSDVPWLPGVLSLVIIIAAFLLLRGKKIPPAEMTGLMLMLGGALGNLADRLIRGFVPDMIEVLFVRFAIFNIADACLCVGCAVVILGLIFGRAEEEKTDGSKDG